MFEALILACIIGYIAFRNWLQHDKRRMIHRERLAAIEKGIELPAVAQEVGRKSWNVQRFLLLAGLSWIFIGVGAFIGLHAILEFARQRPVLDDIPPQGAQFLAIIPLGFGIAHLITFWVGQKREQR